jgi:hypothetical protein
MLARSVIIGTLLATGISSDNFAVFDEMKEVAGHDAVPRPAGGRAIPSLRTAKLILKGENVA